MDARGASHLAAHLHECPPLPPAAKVKAHELRSKGKAELEQQVQAGGGQPGQPAVGMGGRPTWRQSAASVRVPHHAAWQHNSTGHLC